MVHLTSERQMSEVRCTPGLSAQESVLSASETDTGSDRDRPRTKDVGRLTSFHEFRAFACPAQAGLDDYTDRRTGVHVHPERRPPGRRAPPHRAVQLISNRQNPSPGGPGHIEWESHKQSRGFYGLVDREIKIESRVENCLYVRMILRRDDCDEVIVCVDAERLRG